MMDLVHTKQTTIIITTHYIEEARQANVVRHSGNACCCLHRSIMLMYIIQVGLMRDGQLLAESEPNALINSYGMGVGFNVLSKCVCESIISVKLVSQ